MASTTTTPNQRTRFIHITKVYDRGYTTPSKTIEIEFDSRTTASAHVKEQLVREWPGYDPSGEWTVREQVQEVDVIMWLMGYKKLDSDNALAQDVIVRE